VRRITIHGHVGYPRQSVRYHRTFARGTHIRINALTAVDRRAGTILLAAVLIAGSLIAYWPAVDALWRYWVDEPYLGGHGILVAALSAWLLFRSRARINGAPRRALPWALVPLVAASVAALIFWRAGIQALYLLMLPMLIWLSILAGLGNRVARAAAIPVGYLYFAMPAWNVLTPFLQSLTLRAVGILAPALGLPASVAGTFVSFPNGARFEVTPACSGVGFLTQALAVAVLLGELENAVLSRRIKLFAGMLVLALVTNWARVLALLLIGYHEGMDNIIVARHHLEFGYVLFVIALVGFVWLATRADVPHKADSTLAGGKTWSELRVGYLVAVVTLFMPPILVAAISRLHPHDDAVQLAAGRVTWTGPTRVVDATWHPVFVGEHSESQVAYESSDARSLEAVLIAYPMQRQGQELVNENNSLLGNAGLTWESATLVDVGQRTYSELVVTDEAGRKSVIWSYYDIGGREFVVPLLSQLWYGMTALGRPAYSALVAIKAACLPSCAEARAALIDFTRDMGPSLIERRKVSGVIADAKSTQSTRS
jgi:EpsI family protein